MNHFEFKKKYILLLYQTPWKFVDSPAVLEFSHRFEVANGNPILSPGKVINIPYGELTFNISQTIVGSDGVVINPPPGELFFGYSLPRLRIGHGILLNLLNSPYIMNIFYGKPAGDIGHAEAISVPSWQIISHYNTISVLTGVSKFVTIPPGSFDIVYHSSPGDIGDSVGLSTSWAGTLITNLEMGVATSEALRTSLMGSFVAEVDLDISDSIALSTIWTWPTNNMFIVDILVGSGKNLVISYLQASVIYSTIISIYRPIYISYYDDGSLLSDVENMTLEEFSYKQFTP